MSDFDDVVARVREFRDTRDWSQFHNPKDLAISISLEASELLEVFQWSGSDTSVEGREQHACEELADVLIYCTYLADALGVDIAEIMSNKLEANALKYPVGECQGKARKGGQR